MSFSVSRRIVKAIIDDAAGRNSSSLETVELYISVTRPDPHKSAPQGALRLKHPVKTDFKVCVLGDERRCAEARDRNVDCRGPGDIHRMRKCPSEIKCLATQYDGFLASDSVLHDVRRVLGPVLKKADKVPLPLRDSDSLRAKVHECKTTVWVNMKNRLLGLVITVGDATMPVEAVAANIDAAVRSLMDLLEGRRTILTICVRSTIANAYCIYRGTQRRGVEPELCGEALEH